MPDITIPEAAIFLNTSTCHIEHLIKTNRLTSPITQAGLQQLKIKADTISQRARSELASITIKNKMAY